MSSKPLSVEHLWDPLDRNIWKGMFGPNTPNAKRYLARYKTDPLFFVKRQVFMCIPLFLYACLPVLPGGDILLDAIVFAYGEVAAWAVGAVLLLIAGWYGALFNPVREEVAEELLARSLGWESFHHSIHKHWQQFRVPYRNVFDKGTRDQAFSHQFWGTHEGESFWTGEWFYATDTGERRKLRSTEDTRQVVIFRLEDERLDGFDYPLQSGVFYGRKHLGILVLDDLWSEELKTSLYFPKRVNEENKKNVEQKMCSMFKFKSAAINAFDQKKSSLS